MTLVSVKPRVFNNPVDAAFNRMLQQFIQSDATAINPRNTLGWRPAVNIVETDQDFRIELAVPGLDKGDFKLAVDKDVLTISASKTAEKVVGEKLRLQEFSFASFSRSFNLPETVNTSSIGAKYDQGVLAVTLPKKEEALPQPAREIDVL